MRAICMYICCLPRCLLASACYATDCHVIATWPHCSLRIFLRLLNLRLVRTLALCGSFVVSIVTPTSPGEPRRIKARAANLRVPAVPYIHFGRGCDGCGVYPIEGRCYKCADCSEQIGYDAITPHTPLCLTRLYASPLCLTRPHANCPKGHCPRAQFGSVYPLIPRLRVGPLTKLALSLHSQRHPCTVRAWCRYDVCGECYDTGVHSREAPSGRFNQAHRAEHRMEMVHQVDTALHIVQRARPEMSVDQIMALLNVHAQAAEEIRQEEGQEQVEEEEEGEEID